MIICSYSTKCHELVCAQYTFRAEQEKLKKENTTLDSDREYLKRKKHELDKERAHVKRLHVDKMKQMQQLRQDKDSLQQQYHGMAKLMGSGVRDEEQEYVQKAHAALDSDRYALNIERANIQRRKKPMLVHCPILDSCCMDSEVEASEIIDALNGI